MREFLTGIWEALLFLTFVAFVVVVTLLISNGGASGLCDIEVTLFGLRLDLCPQTGVPTVG